VRLNSRECSVRDHLPMNATVVVALDVDRTDICTTKYRLRILKWRFKFLGKLIGLIPCAEAR
jgi:hypothetical protein